MNFERKTLDKTVNLIIYSTLGVGLMDSYSLV